MLNEMIFSCVERIERGKAKELMGEGVDNFVSPENDRKTRDTVAEQIVFESSKQYENVVTYSILIYT